jgi:hypothetical protein
MAQKTRFTEEKRGVVLDYMMDHYDSEQKDTTFAKLRDKAVAIANKVLRKKYPESDIEVLRKYNLTTYDRCLRFVDNESNQVFGVEFPREFKKDPDTW